MATIRTCTICGKPRSIDRFRPGRATCWDCIRKYGSAWYKANRDRINEKRRRHYREHREEICAQWRAKYNSPRPLGPYRRRHARGGWK